MHLVITLKNFPFNLVTTKDIKQLLQILKPKKVARTNSTLSKMIKLTTIPVSRPLAEAKKLFTAQSTFPGNVVSVVRLDKGKPNENKTLKFRPVNILKTSKF